MSDEQHKNMKASPGLEIGLRPENGTYELCDKHYDASKTEAPEHCAVCSLQAKVEALEKDNYSLRNKISLMGWERERARHQEITDGYRQAAQEQDDE